jgi:predicted  nucleic acid-binding Zn-ribbon protein
MSKHEYAEPTHPYADNTSDLSALRLRLQAAEDAVASATSWPERTRAQQDVNIFRRQLNAAETQRRTERATQAQQTQQARPAAMSRQDALVKGVEEGRFMPTKSYFTTAYARQIQSEDELAKLKGEVKHLQKVLDDPATDPSERTRVGIRLSEVRKRIETIEASLPANRETVDEFNRRVRDDVHKANAGHAANAAEPLVSFEDAGKLLKIAHEMGMLKKV